MQTHILVATILVNAAAAVLPGRGDAQGAPRAAVAAPVKPPLSVTHLAMDSAAVLGRDKTAQADQPSDVLLRFQLIEASATESHDPAIADVDAVLRDLFRFGGYKLVAQAAMTVSGAGQGNYASQLLSTAQGSYNLSVTASDLAIAGGQGSVRLRVDLYGLGDAATTAATSLPTTMMVPMIIVDGVVMVGATLRDFHASDIENIEVVKGEAATRRYGAKAAGGAIVIRTKSVAGRTFASPTPAPKPATATAPTTGQRNLLATSVSVSLGRTIVLGSTQPGEPGSALILVVRPELR